jgi:hypothetical protein
MPDELNLSQVLYTAGQDLYKLTVVNILLIGASYWQLLGYSGPEKGTPVDSHNSTHHTGTQRRSRGCITASFLSKPRNTAITVVS